MFPTTSAQSPADPRLLSRRTTVAAAAGLLLAPGLAGCARDASPLAAGPRSLSPRTDDRLGDGDRDARLLGEVLGSIDEVVVVLAAVRRRARGLRASLDPLLALHAAHRDLLTEAAPGEHPRARGRVHLPGGERPTLALVQQREQALVAQLTEAAVDAESGTFARALASMAAGVHQHLHLLRGRAA